MGNSSGGHQAMLLGMRPFDARYGALPSQAGWPTVDATVRCVILCSPVIDPLGRYHYAKQLKAAGPPYPPLVDEVLPNHDAYWKTAEVLDAVLKLWASEGAFTYHGDFFHIDAPPLDPVKDRGYYMKPLQRPHPPIAVAASTPSSGSMRMAGERGFIPMSSSLLARPYLAGHWRLVEDGAQKAGRPAKRSDWRIARDILVAPTRALARERARTVLGQNYVRHQLPNRMGTIQMTSTKLDPSLPDEAVTVDYLMENVWIVGDPAEVTDKIYQLYEESGGFGGLLVITTDSDDASWDHESLRLLMDEVAPRVAHLG